MKKRYEEKIRGENYKTKIEISWWIFISCFGKMSRLIRPLWKGFRYFQHQLDGIHWMLDKEINGVEVLGRDMKTVYRIHGGFQCDDMGLGKTIQMSSVILNNYVKETLLIVPLVMISTWSDILLKMGVMVYHLNTIKRDPWVQVESEARGVSLYLMKNGRPSVYITNYEKLYNNPSVFKRVWGRVVLDEAHRIRNYDGEASRCSRALIGKYRWILTGTPLVNSRKDIVSLMAFLGVPHSKLCRWEKRYEMILPEILLHRSLESLRDVIPDAPPVSEIEKVVLPFCSKEEEEFYLGIQGATEELMKRYMRDMLSSQQMFVLLMRLRQISVHPQVYINAKKRDSAFYKREDWKGASTKLLKIRDIILGDDDKSHKYLIFCQFMDEIEIIRDYLLSEGICNNVFEYHGGMTKAQKDSVLEEARGVQEKSVILVNLMSGNAGLNMQWCDRVIFTSKWWSNSILKQAEARAVRIGQKQVVKIYYLQLQIEAENSINIDRLIEGKAEEKRIMLEEIFSMCETYSS